MIKVFKTNIDSPDHADLVKNSPAPARIPSRGSLVARNFPPLPRSRANPFAWFYNLKY